jgi:uncharacterized protein YbjT (DUF2867 family)
VDPADVAAVAATVLTEPGHDRRTYTLTGPDLLTVPEQLAQLGEVLGVEVTAREIPLAEVRGLFPPELGDVAYQGAALVRSGGNAVLSPDVELVLGRRPGSFRAWADANLLL